MGLDDERLDDPSADDDLTNLTWLQDQNLLKNMTASATERRLLNELNENLSPDEGVDFSRGNVPCNVPPIQYNPQIHVHAKPPYSFSSLIFMAIESSSNKALPVKDIYSWIVEKFPYYDTAPSGWKNTVRHNLSLNKCFRKVDKTKDEVLPLVGKGSLWCIDPELRPNLLQAVRRTPAHVYPYMSAAKASTISSECLQVITSKSQLHGKRSGTLEVQSKVGANILPVLSKRILIPIAKVPSRESKEADAVESMLTLTQYGSSNVVIKSEHEVSEAASSPNSPIVVTVHPSTDHTYYCTKGADDMLRDVSDDEASGASSSSFPDASVDKDVKSNFCNESDDEGVKGAEALLNLSNNNLSKRRLSLQDTAMDISKKSKMSRFE